MCLHNLCWRYAYHGEDLIVTSFPQRWEQPKNDPLNVLDGIIEDMNAKTRPPIKSVYDLAMLITGRCSGMFDRHRLDDEDYHFLDMFESSIGRVTNRETKLFDRFNRSSTIAAKWLKDHRKHRGRGILTMASSPGENDDEDVDNPIFVDALLDIGTETELLGEIKDIRDELNIIRLVLRAQSNVLPDFADHISDELGGKRSVEAGELRKRSKDQQKVIDVHIENLDRMDKQADLIYVSLTHLLDLKQKHANAFEARFARDQAAWSARQGQTIMVFTLVTIIFLPMSFIASMFSISVQEFPRVQGQQSIPLGYVSKYTFGIGLAISIPLILISFFVDDAFMYGRKVVQWFLGKKESDEEPPEKTLWERRYSESRFSDTEKPRDRDRSTYEGLPRESFGRARDLSPLSERTQPSLSPGGNQHIVWARSSYEHVRARFTPVEDTRLDSRA
jgi:Mg2+ and Co2+ transporter CorA